MSPGGVLTRYKVHVGLTVDGRFQGSINIGDSCRATSTFIASRYDSRCRCRPAVHKPTADRFPAGCDHPAASGAATESRKVHPLVFSSRQPHTPPPVLHERSGHSGQHWNDPACLPHGRLTAEVSTMRDHFLDVSCGCGDRRVTALGVMAKIGNSR